MRWVIPAVIIAYVVAIIWAYNAGMDPWVVAVAIPALVGWPWFCVHMSHAIHSDLWGGGWIILAIAGVVAFLIPLVTGNTALSVPMLWFFTTGGAIGIIWLIYEMGHVFHHHPSGTVVVLGMVFLAAGLYLTRPAGATIALTPPITPRVMPTRSTGHPGFGGASSSGGSGATPAPTASASKSGGALDCSRLSPRARQAAGCR